MRKTDALSLAAGLALSLAVGTTAVAQDDKKDDANTQKHCNSKVAQMCDQLNPFMQASPDAWRVAAYAATVCNNSSAIQTERRKRRDRIEYEDRVAKAAREQKKEHTPWVPSEDNASFAARTTQSCDGSYAFYCSEMRKEADGLKAAETKTAALGFIDTVCGSQTAAAAPAAAPAPAPAKK
ncbi:MAG: hypothetical protein SFV19_18460 [Rhodospirillaceae bacterium]|nr:hypothetical protein [Rhodospirillaceae bacterium]